jgi:hypothetical protein
LLVAPRKRMQVAVQRARREGVSASANACGAADLESTRTSGDNARKMVGHSKNAEEMTVRYSSADDEERIEIQRREFGDALQTKKETPKGKSLGVGHSQRVLGTLEN